MYAGKNSIGELATEVARMTENRRDFIAPVGELEAIPGEQLPHALRINGHGMVGINQIAHEQFSDYIGTDRAYYNRLRDQHPALWAQTFNTLVREKPNAKRMVRTLDGTARAFLGPRYRPIDNADLLAKIMPDLMGRPDLHLASCEVTDRRLYVKLTSHELVGEVKPGDVVRMGLLIRNSEVGFGSVLVAPFTERLVCSNGAVHLDFGKRKNHVGRELGLGDDGEAAEMYADETRRAEDEAFYLKVRDNVRAILSGDTLANILDGMREGLAEQITGDPVKTVEAVGRHHGLTDAERAATLRHLITGSDLSRWGLANAVTRAAHDKAAVGNYDRATELETVGGTIMFQPIPAVAEVSRKRKVRRGAAMASMVEQIAAGAGANN